MQTARNSKRPGKLATKGTVAALKPTPALTVPENITVSEASQLCAAKRTDCVLVVDEEEGLSGIFTAKDLAYRVRISIDFMLPFFLKYSHRSLQLGLILIRRLSAKL
jgi:CBS domain containing-hemolysin-like protein